jgi:AcrR family transcriptional regulator
MAEAPTISRRERLRQETLAEIKRHALEQIGEGGTAALSLNAIAKAMGMSGPAIYRYFASRDELLAALVHDGYGELTRVIVETAANGPERTPADRLRAVAIAYQGWAREHRHHYGMLFGARPAGFRDPEEAIDVIDGAMAVLLAQLGAIVGGAPVPTPSDDLTDELERWSARRQFPDGTPVVVLRLGLLAWTRMHGVVGLELAGIFADMEIDPGLLVAAEIDEIIATAEAAHGGD